MITNSVKAQWHKWQFGGGVGSLIYHGDLSDRFVNANLQELGYHAFVERMISKKSGVYWRLESVNGHLLGSDRAPGGWINGTSPHFERSLNFRTEIHDVNTSLVFYFASNRKRENPPFLNAYLKAGIGVGFFDVKGDLRDADGNFYQYWSDKTIRDIPENAPNASEAQIVKRDYNFETDLLSFEVEKEYNRFKWQIPLALGLKMKLGNAVSLNLEAQYTYAMTDYIDNVGDEKVRTNSGTPYFLQIADPAGYIGDRPRNLDKPTGINDGYLYVSAGLSFNVGKYTKPQPKTPKFYPRLIVPEIVDTIDSILIKDTLSLIHPFDTLYNISQQTYVVDTNRTLQDTDLLKKEKLSSTNQKSDSLFLEFFQHNYKLWLIQDSLTADKKVDSVIIAPLDNYEKKYVVQYYESVLDSSKNEISKVFQTDTLILDTEKKILKRDTNIYETGETYFRFKDSYPIPTDTTIEAIVADSTQQEIANLRSKLLLLEQRYQKDTTEISNVYSITEDVELDTLSPSPSNYRLIVPEYKDTIQTSVIAKRLEIDSSYQKVHQELYAKIEALESKNKLTLDSIKIQKDSTPTQQEDSLTFYKQKYEEFNSRLKTTIKDSIPSKLKSDTLSSKSVNVKESTIVQPDSNQVNNKIEELKARIRALEKDSIEKSTETSVIVPKSEVKNQKVVKEQAVQDTTNYVVLKEVLSSEPVVMRKSNVDTSLNGRLAQLEQQILQQKFKSDSLQKIAEANNAKVVQLDEPQISAVQKDLEQKIKNLEKQLAEEQSKTPKNNRKNKNSEDEVLAQQRKIDSLNSALQYYQYSSDVLQRDRYLPQNTYPYNTYPNNTTHSSGIQPVIEPVITIPIDGNSRKEKRQQKKAASTSVSEDVEVSDSKKTQVGFNHNSKPGFIESKRMKKEGSGSDEVSSESSDTAQAESVELDSIAIDSTSSIMDSTLSANSVTIESKLDNRQPISATSDSTKQEENNVNQSLADENKWLKAQMSDIQKTQDSLLALLQELMMKSNQAVVIEKEAKAEVDRSQLIEGIINQPSSKVFFAVGKSAVTSQYKLSLDQLAQQLRNYPELKIELKGFADPTGNVDANLRLSEKRAQAVKTYLTQTHKISADKIIVLPVGQEDSSSDMSYSRRVEVKLFK